MSTKSHSNMNISEDSLKQLKCTSCNLYLSVNPITGNKNNSFLCGRCSSDGEQVTIYEVLVENFAFPCFHRPFGCKETRKWGPVLAHEQNCTKKPFLCPIMKATSACIWYGTSQDMIEHFKQTHAEDVSDYNLTEIKFYSNLLEYKLIKIKDNHYLLRIHFNKEQSVLKVNVMRLDCTKTQTYQLTVHSHDLSKRIVLATRCIEAYSSIDNSNIKDENVIHVSVLKFLSPNKSSIFCEITLPEEDVKINTNLLKLLECPICNNCMNSPIYQCRTGHSFCNDCVSKLKICPLCNQELTKTRNYAFENVVNQISQNCKNKNLGCTYSGVLGDVEEHEKTCYLYKCPLQGSSSCSWSGNFKSLIQHCKKSHVFLESQICGIICFLPNFVIEMDGSFRLLYCDGVFFKICRKFCNEEYCVVVQFIGPSDIAASYSYQLSFIGSDNSEANFCLKDVCQVLTDDENAFDNCVKIPHSLFKSYAKNNKLKCAIKIFKRNNDVAMGKQPSNSVNC